MSKQKPNPSPKDDSQKKDKSQTKSELMELAIQFRTLVSKSGGDERLEEIWYAGLAGYAKAGSKKEKLHALAKLAKKGRKLAGKSIPPETSPSPKPPTNKSPRKRPASAAKKSAPAKKKSPAPRKSPAKRPAAPAAPGQVS